MDNLTHKYHPSIGKNCEPESYDEGDPVGVGAPPEETSMASDDGYHDVSKQSEFAKSHGLPAVSEFPENLEGPPLGTAPSDPTRGQP
jgi:hypothetical protein